MQNVSFPTAASKALLGAHMSIGGGLHRAIERSCSIACRAMQIFVKNNMQWFARALTREEIREVILHLVPYAGIPAAVEAISAAAEVLPPWNDNETDNE